MGWSGVGWDNAVQAYSPSRHKGGGSSTAVSGIETDALYNTQDSTPTRKTAHPVLKGRIPGPMSTNKEGGGHVKRNWWLREISRRDLHARVVRRLNSFCCQEKQPQISHRGDELAWVLYGRPSRRNYYTKPSALAMTRTMTKW